MPAYSITNSLNLVRDVILSICFAIIFLLYFCRRIENLVMVRDKRTTINKAVQTSPPKRTTKTHQSKAKKSAASKQYRPKSSYKLVNDIPIWEQELNRELDAYEIELESLNICKLICEEVFKKQFIVKGADKIKTYQDSLNTKLKLDLAVALPFVLKHEMGLGNPSILDRVTNLRIYPAGVCYTPNIFHIRKSITSPRWTMHLTDLMRSRCLFLGTIDKIAQLQKERKSSEILLETFHFHLCKLFSILTHCSRRCEVGIEAITERIGDICGKTLSNEEDLETCSPDILSGFTSPEKSEKIIYEPIQKSAPPQNRENHEQTQSSTKKDPGPKEPNPIVEYKRFLCQGKEAYQGGQYSLAMELYKEAHRIATDKTISEQPTRVTVLKYLYGKCCRAANSAKSFRDAVDVFRGILNETVSFPAAFFGLGSTLVCLRRYDEALEIVEEGLRQIETIKTDDVEPIVWPGTDIVIEETKLSVLQLFLFEIKQECCWPPPPDARCFYCNNSDIFTSDPEYKGHIRLYCFEKCDIALHLTCWKKIKSSLGEKVNDRDMIDSPCLTPDCESITKLITIHKKDQREPIKFLSVLNCKPLAKLTPAFRPKLRSDNPEKIKKKITRKELKKKKKEESKQLTTTATTVDVPIIRIKEVFPDDYPLVLEPEGQFVELKKDEDVLLQRKLTKQVKTKIKKEKTKQFVNIDFTFVGDEEKERVLDADKVVVKHPEKLSPIFVPDSTTEIYNPFSIGHGKLPSSFTQSNLLDTETEDLYQYFTELLQCNGPLDLEGPEIQEALTRLSEEDQARIFGYGGLSYFLRDRINFIVLKNQYVCLFEDHSKAKELMKKKLAKDSFWEQRAREREHRETILGAGDNVADKSDPLKPAFKQSSSPKRSPPLRSCYTQLRRRLGKRSPPLSDNSATSLPEIEWPHFDDTQPSAKSVTKAVTTKAASAEINASAEAEAKTEMTLPETCSTCTTSNITKAEATATEATLAE